MANNNRFRISHAVIGILTAILLQAGTSLPAFAQEVHHFEIDATDVATAIHQFGSQSGVQILASAEALNGKRLNKISGDLATEDGFQKLLAGTGLSHRYVGERAVALVSETPVARKDSSQTPTAPQADGVGTVVSEGKEGFWSRFRSAQADTTSKSDTNSRNEEQETSENSPESSEKRTKLGEIIVTGSQVALPGAYAGDQVARGGRVGMFGNLDNMDTPFVSTSYTAELMLDQQAKSVADALLNDPVVRVARGFGNFQELYIIRGFPVFSDDMTYNGIYGILPRQFVAAEFLERVELFRGANSFLNGAAPGGSGVGGAVNLVPKRAPGYPLTRTTLGYENDSAIYVGLDVGRRFGAGDSTGFRFNAARRDGETSVHDQDRELTVLSLGTDYQGERLRLSADIGFQDHHIDSPRPSVTPSVGIANAPDGSSNFAQPWTFTDERQLFAVVRGEFDMTDNSSVWAAAGMRDGEESNVLSNPSADANGDTYSYRFDNFREDKIYSGEVGVKGEFNTGSMSHTLILSGSVFSLESKNAYAFSNFFAGFTGNLYNPTEVAAPPADFFTGGSLSDPNVTQETDTSSLAIADMISFADGKAILTVGFREQNLETKTFNYNTGAQESSYDESKVTPVAGIVFRPSDSISIFGNYVEGLVPGDIAPAFSGGGPVTNAGEVFDPYQAEQYEAGVKYDSGDFGGTLSAFRLSKPSGLVEGGVFSVSGEQQNQGVELSVFGQPRDNFRILGGLTWLDAELTRTQDNAFDGNTAVGAPDLQVNVNFELDLPAISGLTLESRVVYTSSQYADAANTTKVPSWIRFDVGARYATEIGGRPFSVRLRLDNVSDESDWVSVGGYPGANYLVLGVPRTVVVSASMDF